MMAATGKSRTTVEVSTVTTAKRRKPTNTVHDVSDANIDVATFFDANSDVSPPKSSDASAELPQ